MQHFTQLKQSRPFLVVVGVQAEPTGLAIWGKGIGAEGEASVEVVCQVLEVQRLLDGDVCANWQLDGVAVSAGNEGAGVGVDERGR